MQMIAFRCFVTFHLFVTLAFPLVFTLAAGISLHDARTSQLSVVNSVSGHKSRAPVRMRIGGVRGA